MTCLCGHPCGDHQNWDDMFIAECSLCECRLFTDAATPPMFGDDDD